MKTNECHEWYWARGRGQAWARLKKDILIDDPDILHLLAGDSFVLPANTIVWVLPSTRRTVVHITLNPELLVRNGYAYQCVSVTDYNDLLEPLE